MSVPLKVIVTSLRLVCGQAQKRIMTLASCVAMRQSRVWLGGIVYADTKRPARELVTQGKPLTERSTRTIEDPAGKQKPCDHF